MTNNTSLTIISTAIRQDTKGRYCLNDCHKASGGAKKDGPSYWLATEQAAKIAARLDTDTTGKSVVTVEGRNGGTYVAKELVYAYAMWISADFSLTVIRAFDALVQGVAPAAPTVRIAKPRRPSLISTFRTGYSIAKMMGYDENRAGFYAGDYCEKKCGENPVVVMGITALPSPSNDRDFTPTQIGEKMGGIKAEKINTALIEIGFQTVELDRKNRRSYHLTERGKEFGRLNDATKSHSAGSVPQVRWYESVIPTLTAHFNETRTPVPFPHPREAAS